MVKKTLAAALAAVLALSSLTACGTMPPGDRDEIDSGPVDTSYFEEESPDMNRNPEPTSLPADGKDFKPKDLSDFMLSDAPVLEIPVGPGPLDYENQDYDAWQAAQRTYLDQMDAFRDADGPGLDELRPAYLDFIVRTAPSVFRDENFNAKSGAYSPLSMYAALCMLSRCAAHDTRTDLVKFLGLWDAEAMNPTQRAVDAIYRNLQFLYGDQALTLANSIWLNAAMLSDGALNQNTLDELNRDFYAGTFAAQFGTETAEQAVADWMYNQTRGLISAKPEADEYTVALLMNALYYKDAWSEKFSPNNTIDGVFTAADGSKQNARLMRQTDTGYAVVKKNYIAADMYASNGYVRFFLPDEGASVQSLISDPEFLAEICRDDFVQTDGRRYDISWTVPKFDASSDLDLTQAMLDAGLPDLNGDYSALSDILDIMVSQIRQLTHIKADEDGFEAAAVTVIATKTTGIAPRNDKLEITLDRPFGFVIMSRGMPLFIGAVNDIAQ